MAKYPNKNGFSDHRNRLYGKSASLRCGGKLFHSPGPAAAKALSPKVSCGCGPGNDACLTLTDVTAATWGRLYVSVTLVHPAKVAGRNEMPFGRDTRVVPSNIVLDRGPGAAKGRGDLGVVGTPSSQRCRLSPNYFGPCYYYFHTLLNWHKVTP